MNGLTLRINPSNNAKMKSLNFAPVSFQMPDRIGLENDLFNDFLNASTADEQLVSIKNIFEGSKNNSNVMSFLALVFLEAEVKHPVKCFLVRHINRSDSLQPSFSEQLAIHIHSYTARSHSVHQSYTREVVKIATCIESFPAGVAAIKLVEIQLAFYLIKCLECCVSTIRNVRSLAPTEKNEIFSLAHLSLRLILCIIQKINEDNSSKLVSMFNELRLSLKELLFDEDSPMDTKTLCGILLLNMTQLENGPDSWIKILDTSQSDDYTRNLLHNEASDLSLHSAIVTVVPLDRLQSQQIGGTPALICLTDHIIAIGERTSSESVFTLSVARTVVQISKWLPRVRSTPGNSSGNSSGGLLGALLSRVAGFCWSHADHYMDSVRHLSAQGLANVTRCAAALDAKGDPSALQVLVSALRGVGRGSKSYYVAVGALATQLAAGRVRDVMPRAVGDVIDALQVQQVQASASAALEILLEKHARESDSAALYETWVVPALRAAAAPGTPAHAAAVHNLMVKVLKRDDGVVHYIVPEIDRLVSSLQTNLRSILVLVQVVRKGGAGPPSGPGGAGGWRGLLPYDALYAAAVHADDDIRILCLALVAESPKSTECYYKEELDLILYFLRYNINAQAPNFRQHMLALFGKFMKRLGDSFKLVKRQTGPTSEGDKVDYYLSFVERLRDLCFDSLTGGANYSRRVGALQILAACQDLALEGYCSTWREQYVDRLLHRLEDTYDANRALALRILQDCPRPLLESKKYRVSIELEDILQQASSLKPADCVSAAHKLMLLKEKLPHRILDVNPGLRAQSEPVWFALASILLERVKAEVSENAVNVASARAAPVYGLLHCLRQPLLFLDPQAISSDPQWSSLISDTIVSCMRASALAGRVVNNASPEGHLPMDAGSAFTHTGNSGGIVSEGGRPVTAQMLLLCAWRTVKEVSLLLGSAVSRLTIQGEGQESGTLSQQQVISIGDHFTALLTETKHRGAFEQAYVGFTHLLARLWQCLAAGLHGWGRAGLRALLGGLATPRGDPTRRSAGLPFMIQALVITELQVKGNPTCLHECMNTLLKLARATSPDTIQSEDNECKHQNADNEKSNSNNSDVIKQPTSEDDEQPNMDLPCKDSMVESRTHCMNILRALFRNSALEESVAGYVGEGIMVALEGFDRDTWMERNAATLLFSALVARVFGPTHTRHTMTGRIFFLRYPALYDTILKKLQEAEANIEHSLSPGLFPVLTLLGRLYPSALEGVESALRLQALAPRLPPAARSPARAARHAAARVPPVLMHPTRYIPHIEWILTEISSTSIKKNYCHGLLLQLSRLLEAIPDDLVVDDETKGRLAKGVRNCYWILEQSIGRMPCYPIAEELVKFINLFIWRFSNYIEKEQEMLETIKNYLHKILFAEIIPPITAGREVCLANIAYLYIIILNKKYEFSQNLTEEESKHTSKRDKHLEEIISFVQKCLDHKSYEVVLSALNYFLILSNILEIDCHFQKHLASLVMNGKVRPLLAQESFAEKLSDLLKRSKYLECIQKILKILSLEDNTQKYIVELKLGRKPLNNEEIVRTLIHCIQNEHENVIHIYLESLLRFVSSLLQQGNKDCLKDALIVDVIRVVFDCCTSENDDNTRKAVAEFLQKAFWVILGMGFNSLTAEEKFELQATLYAAAVTCLEDDDPAIRQSMADALWLARGNKMAINGSAVAESGNAVAESGNVVAESGKVGAESDNAVTESDNAVAESGNAMAESGSAVAESGTAVAESGNAVAENGNAVAESVNVVAENGNVVSESGNVVSESGNVVSESGNVVAESGSVVAARAATWMRDYLATSDVALPLLTLIALLDFKSEVCMADEISDQCRVFDQNERYNIFLEETVWTSECADKIIELTNHSAGERNAVQCVCAALEQTTYRETFQKLCGDNLVLFDRMVEDNELSYKYDVVNPKIEVFVSKLLGK